MNLLDKINEIKAATGNEKIEVMRRHPEMKAILKYAYDPFKKFYLTSEKSGLDMIQGTQGGLDIYQTTKFILDGLASRTYTGQEAIEIVCDHMVSLNPDAAEVFKRIINKDLRCGINVKSINKAFPGLIPMVWDGSKKPPFALCKTFDLKKAKYPLLVAIKKDGVRAQMVSGKMVSRQGKQLIGHNHIERVLSGLPYDLDGELCIPGMIFDEASGKIRDNNQTPGSVFWVFDSPNIPGTKLDRYKKLAELFSQFNNNSSVKLIEHANVDNEEELLLAYGAAIKLDEEGVVIYNPEQEYEDGRIWWRLVPIKSEDLPVVGFFEGKGKHAWSLGGIIVDYKGHKVKVGTGFKEKILKSQEKQLVTDIDKKLLTSKSKAIDGLSLDDVHPLWLNIRQFIWDNQKLFLDKMSKVEYKEKTKAGSLRQPRFSNWRFDK